MIYNIITYLIVALSLFLAGKKIYMKIFTNKQPACESGCGGCTSKCELRNLAGTPKVNP